MIAENEVKNAEQLEQELNLIKYKRALSRRTFMERVGMASVAVVGISALNGCLSSKSMAQGVSQADVLNFALNLEYLEAEFYLYGTTGTGLAASDQGTATGPTTGGAQAPLTGTTLAIMQEIANDEKLHVKFLRTALGAAAVPKPAINLAALGNAFASQAAFIGLARAFEDVGVSAYGGAATLLSGDNLQAAAQILATEAYHAGNVRLQAAQQVVAQAPVDSRDQVASLTNFFPTDTNGLALTRTTSQVLSIVYASATAGTTSGGFYPQGMNGTIKTV
ncbi:MAG TPA: ferritin-like domain-containing protein [Terriglobales bacterium]|nr:ferritin-like domain-containing protein [Terriglobales bacterium]